MIMITGGKKYSNPTQPNIYIKLSIPHEALFLNALIVYRRFEPDKMTVEIQSIIDLLKIRRDNRIEFYKKRSETFQASLLKKRQVLNE